MTAKHPFHQFDDIPVGEIIEFYATAMVSVPLCGFMLDWYIDPRMAWWEEFREYINDRAEEELEWPYDE